MRLALRYPIYVIANQDGVLVVNEDGEDCVLLFHTMALAQRHIDQNPGISKRIGLHPLAVPNAKFLREGLRDLPAEVKCAVWDAGTHSAFVHVGVDELLVALSG